MPEKLTRELSAVGARDILGVVAEGVEIMYRAEAGAKGAPSIQAVGNGEAAGNSHHRLPTQQQPIRSGGQDIALK